MIPIKFHNHEEYQTVKQTLFFYNSYKRQIFSTNRTDCLRGSDETRYVSTQVSVAVVSSQAVIFTIITTKPFLNIVRSELSINGFGTFHDGGKLYT